MQHYSPEEDRIILKYYRNTTMTELLEMLPNRTEYSVRNRYLRLTGRKTSKREHVCRTDTVKCDNEDEYLNQIFHDFCLYIAKSRSILVDSHGIPDVQCMMNTFRDIYKRTIVIAQNH